jgi:hypothetical protein
VDVPNIFKIEVSKRTGITRATTAPRILAWIRRYLVIPVAGDVIGLLDIYVPDTDSPP